MKNCHFIGIGGIGMSGLAKLLLQKKIAVSGSDQTNNTIIEDLEKSGAKIFLEHAKAHVQPGHTVVYNSQISTSNLEFEAAKEFNCPTLHRSDLLQLLMQEFHALTVTGTHGKTSTTGMLISVLLEAGLDPSYATGGILTQTQTNANLGKGAYFVAEADESDGSFLKYTPFGAIITNIDFDHMDFFQTKEQLLNAFHRFALKVHSQKHLLWCGDSPLLYELKLPGFSYGFKPYNSLRASHFEQKGWSLTFDIHFQEKHFPKVTVPAIGKHQALNALAVFGMGLLLEIPEEKIRKGLLAYQGTARRTEKKGSLSEVLVLDDYGHHPAEIETTLLAIRNAIQEKRLILVFQPHRFSRTKDCLGTFGKAMKEADLIVLTDIYAAGETPIQGITSEKVLEDIKQALPKKRVLFFPRQQLLTFLSKEIRPHDCLVTMGAGDITYLGKELVDHLKINGAYLRMGLVFGGCSKEHEVSLLSARNLAKHLNKEIYKVNYFGISKEGKWVQGEIAEKCLNENFISIPEPETDVVMDNAICSGLQDCALIFPILHGPFGEDGKIQGFLETLGIPYVGSGPLACALSMDKAITKKLALFHGIPTSPFIDFSEKMWEENRGIILEEILVKLTFPVFVKPTHLGSTIGIKKAENLKELEDAISHAFSFDTHLLVENGIEGREIEFPVIGNEKCHVFPPGEIPMMGDMYGYDEKYGHNAVQPIAKAEISNEKRKEGMELAKKVYQILGCQGWARIDCFLDKQNRFWLNEVNPIPGCTKNSLYPLACMENGLTFPKLLDQLILLGLKRYEQRKSK